MHERPLYLPSYKTPGPGGEVYTPGQVIPPDSTMEGINSEKMFLIIIFNVVVPSLDQATDINLVRRLLVGPEDQFHIYSGEIISLS